MEFVVDDSTEVDIDSLPNMVRRVVDLLDRTEDGKLYTNRRIANLLGVQHRTVGRYGGDPALADYRISLPGRKNYYGNKKTVATFKNEMLGEEG
jgi:hypothetical protein